MALPSGSLQVCAALRPGARDGLRRTGRREAPGCRRGPRRGGFSGVRSVALRALQPQRCGPPSGAGDRPWPRNRPVVRRGAPGKARVPPGRAARRPVRGRSPGRAGHRLGRRGGSGASRARTDDLRHAMAALSQLSYGPLRPKCNRELVVPCPVHELALVVARRGKAKKDLRLIRKAFVRQKEALLELRTVEPRTRRSLVRCRDGAPARPEYADWSSSERQRRRLVLLPICTGSEQGALRAERSCEATTLEDRTIDLDAQLRRFPCDRHLRAIAPF